MILFDERKRPATILLVDSDEDYRRHMVSTLKQSGHHVTAYATASEALSAGYYGDYDIALLDVQLNDMNGVELAKRLNPLPVLFITQNGNPSDIEVATDEDNITHICVGYVLKSSDYNRIEIAVNAAVRIARVLRNQQQLLESLNNTLEEEKRALARELHDQLGQLLVTAKWDSTAILNWPEDDIDIDLIKDKARRIITALEQVATTTNAIIEHLRPEDLETLGLKRAIERMVRQWSERRPECDYQLSIDGLLMDVDDGLRNAVYRIIQEALTNIAKHSNATTVSINIYETVGESLVLVINDNGKGFKQQDLSSGRHGLKGMRERAAGLGGKLTVDSEPDKGTSIRFAIRYKPRARRQESTIQRVTH